MSLQYNEYLEEHIWNVEHGLRWIADNLNLRNLGISENDISQAIDNVGEHDRSKFDITEYRAYDDYFYGGNKSHAVKTAFDEAWLHHQHVNPHHWQYWVLINDDDGENRALEMPISCILEMIADWWSFSWKEENLMEIFDWYDSHKDKMILHERTRKFVESILKEMRKILEMQKKHETGYVGEAEEDHLEHHGILGQKWGQRNGPPYPLKEGDHSKNEQKLQGLQNLNGAKTANMEKWGADEDHNVLYIAGYSGSGKSTTALALKKPGDSVIHLDIYAQEVDNDEIQLWQDKDFNKFLDAHVDDWRAIQKATKNGEGVAKLHSKEYWNKVEELDKAIDNFAKQKYKDGGRVIVEGVQIADNWLKETNDGYAGKPIVILQNGPIKSMSRAFERDGRGNLFQGLKSLDDAKEYADAYYQMVKNLNGLADVTGAKKKAYVFDDEFSHSDIEDDHLEHHGILGQKWGQRNGPPYPLDRNPLDDYSKEKITKATIDKYKDQAKQLSHVRINQNTNGTIFTNNGKLVGMINVEEKDDGHRWIQGLELFGDGKGKGLSYDLLDYATNELGATHLSVNKENSIAKHVYDKYGFQTYDETGDMYFMKFEDELSHSESEDEHQYGVPEQKKFPLHASTRVIGKVVDTHETENGLEVAVEHSEPEDDEDLYGVPEQKKFPLPDADHVRSAIRFFNWVDPKYEKELAKAILEKMDEYGMSFDDFGVGDENRFKKYIPEEDLKKKNEEKSK